MRERVTMAEEVSQRNRSNVSCRECVDCHIIENNTVTSICSSKCVNYCERISNSSIVCRVNGDTGLCHIVEIATSSSVNSVSCDRQCDYVSSGESSGTTVVIFNPNAIRCSARSQAVSRNIKVVNIITNKAVRPSDRIESRIHDTEVEFVILTIGEVRSRTSRITSQRIDNTRGQMDIRAIGSEYNHRQCIDTNRHRVSSCTTCGSTNSSYIICTAEGLSSVHINSVRIGTGVSTNGSPLIREVCVTCAASSSNQLTIGSTIAEVEVRSISSSVLVAVDSSNSN